MKEGKGAEFYTATLVGGPGNGVNVEVGYPPLPMIIKYNQGTEEFPRYCVYARKINTVEYHHIQGCCRKGKP